MQHRAGAGDAAVRMVRRASSVESRCVVPGCCQSQMVGSSGLCRLSKRDWARARWCGQGRRRSPGRVQLCWVRVLRDGKEAEAHAVDGNRAMGIV